MTSTTETRPTPPAPDDPRELAGDAVALVRQWLAEAAAIPVDASAKNLAGVLRDPGGLPFTVGFVDGVIRPEDDGVAARKLAEIAADVPAFLPWYLKTAVRAGGALGPVAPGVVIPAARAALRRMVGHLLVDATESRLGPALERIAAGGNRLNINLLGEAVLGTAEAGRRLEGTAKLLARDDVDYVSIKVSSTVSPTPLWAFDEAVADIVGRLTPLYRQAAGAAARKFINLDMEEYKDLRLTVAVFRAILDQPEFASLTAGIVIQAYLPDAIATIDELTDWAKQRVAAGGAPIKIRVVKGANLPMEHVEADLHDWPAATWPTKQATDANYKAILVRALTPENLAAVRIGVAGHNLFDVAFAWLLASARGVQDGIDVEMLLGMAQAQATAVRRTVGQLLLYTPVVHPDEFDVAIAYLVRRLEEGASPDNFMSAVTDLADEPALLEREQARFLAFLDDMAALDGVVPAPARTQDRATERPLEAPLPDRFANTADTDASLPANRDWGRLVLERARDSRAGVDLLEASRIEDAGELDAVLRSAAEAGAAWGARSGAERAGILHRAGQMLAARRFDLIEVMAAEAGKTIDQADPEVSEATDFAHYYAEQARGLDAVDGATFAPARLTLVTPPWNFPVAIPAGSTLAALAAGSAVVLKPAGPASRCGAVLAQALWDAGVPREVLRFMQVGEEELGRELVAHASVDRVILTGSYETAELFRSFRPDLPLLAETSGKNAIVVTGSADLDLAVRDVIASAFGHAGQKCSAASLVILVGPVRRSARFLRQLEDGVRSLMVGWPQDPRTQMGPIIEPAAGKLAHALTTLERGEHWLVQPRQLDEDGRLWSPGVRMNVKAGSPFHQTEYFGPVLGVMTADTLSEALELQNGVAYGLTAGLHSLDPEEIGHWLEHVEAGNVYVNRGITGAIVRRQPFGGWKRSAVGPGTKAGGPSYLMGLGAWRRSEATASPAGVLLPAVTALVAAAARSGSSAGFLDRSVASDQVAWEREFGLARDVSGLHAERNILRYLPVPVRVRLAAGGDVADLIRVAAAGLRAGSRVSISSPELLPEPIRTVLASAHVDAVVESDAQFARRAADLPGGRIRLIGAAGPALDALMAAVGPRPDIAVYAGEVTEAGRVELLPFLHEQAVSITAHRFGTPDHLTDRLI
ncbi:bifunctional proline dehydrogenase/L-glutamate gamma-semialdehyde dehydrogenase [Tersicoccus sp. Bi-70]|uniref:bifunctional proline dehydrogenase/L-glutamate gamma-semialdehyde dehydrogenase n=1 Tax=Tersicoccus sp. Bi-70 TaxID=1897634 RepID=UPI0009753FFB|nr:bifunctional proline dehydrogenase/L-glutamate gamma-semialdehyde dehydrogenase [Tersicoccus sp. Bi-70]OMH31262.1 1-pyrroline-5-carboxylate dehydrogenase [Tersicoccus sp. Bi-70]